jgi:ribosomal protein L7/L12
MTLLYIVIVIIFVLVSAFIIAQNKISKLRKIGLYPKKGTGTLNDVKKLVNEGYMIEAIKLYREIKNVGLKEAKEEVEKIIKNN